MRVWCAFMVALGLTGCESGPDQAAPLPPAGDSAVEDAPAVDDTAPAVNEEAVASALRGALEQRLRGDGPRAAEGHTWFSAETAGALRDVVVVDGHATVDFADLSALIPNASSSAGSALLLDELNSTVFSIADIESVEYRMEGSCARFWEWLQYGCQTVQRP
jgi:hypothetical protein